MEKKINLEILFAALKKQTQELSLGSGKLLPNETKLLRHVWQEVRHEAGTYLYNVLPFYEYVHQVHLRCCQSA